MSETTKSPAAPDEASRDTSKANAVQPGKPAGEIAPSDPSAVPPPNAG